MDYHKIANPYFEGVATELEQVVIDAEKGVSALYSPQRSKIKTYLFDKKVWNEADARDYVAEKSLDAGKLETKAHIKRTEKGMLAIASDETVDRDGEVISVDGWELDNFKRNPVLLWAHNRSMAHDGRPIGTATNIKFRTIDGQKRLTFVPEFDDSTEFNASTKKMVEKGLLNTFSVGFLPKEREENKYTKQELLEISLVSVPSNASASFIQRSKGFGFTEDEAKEYVEKRCAVPYRAYSPAPESREWSHNAAKARARAWANSGEVMDYDKYKEAYAWHDADNVGGAYKLLHHDVMDGELVTTWKGVASAMATLLGAKGGVNIPEEDRRKVYDHLVEHYKQYGKVAPSYRLVETQELKEMFDLYSQDIEKRAFAEFKKIMRQTREMVTEMKASKKAEEKKSDTLDSKLALSLTLLKGIDENITASLKGETSHTKKEVK